MKVVRKGKCDSGPVDTKMCNIPRDVVFSGKPRGYDQGVFYKCERGCIRLAYDTNHACDGMLFEDGIVQDYKELNAYLCIEE